MHAHYVRMHGRVKYIYSGVGEWFFRVPHTCFDLGKPFPHTQEDGEWVNLKVVTKKIAVHADASRLRLLKAKAHGQG